MAGKKEQVKKYAYIYSVTEDVVLEVWNYWLSIHGAVRGKPHIFTETRRRAVEKGIGLFGKETAMKAILGCSFSDFHMGGNDAGKKYNSVELIFRDEWRVAKFVDLAEEYSERE